MTYQLETAQHPETLRRVAIDPVSRVEGHGKVTILLADQNKVHQVRLHIVEFRGFEKFIQGRPYWEVPVMVQRLCGICPVSHHLAAAKALDPVVGALAITPTAEKIRRLMHYGQILQSHALHFFHLSSPDLLFGFESPVQQRNIVGVAAAYPDVARQGVLLRKFGQEVIRVTAGKRVHGTGAIPGGVNKLVSREDRDLLRADADQMIAWSRDAVHLARRLHETNGALYDEFGLFRSHLLSLVRADGALDLYVAALGPAKGWYKVGPLARVQNCDFIPSPLAEAERLAFIDHGEGEPIHAPLAYHWARMIEMLHAAEVIRGLLDDPDLLSDNRLAEGPRQREGVGIIEAPRGTLIHHYRVGDDDLVSYCNLIVSTTHNNQAMNEAVRQVARRYLDGRQLTEGLLNHIEVAIRAFDPCLSCATHALGKMPLAVELLDADGALVDRATSRR